MLWDFKNIKHYIYCDSTWNLWSTSSTLMRGYSKRLLFDAEGLEKKSYDQATHIFTISHYVKKNIIEHYKIKPEKITVVGSGLGVIKPYYGIKNYANGSILFVAKGRFQDKGGPLVLKAMEIISRKNKKINLTIVGQGEYLDINGLDNVKTLGFIEIDQLQKLFNESSLFLMPAKNEPWGLVYLEALACKMPIIGININSFPEISSNGEFGFSLYEETPESLANIIMDAFSNLEIMQAMGYNGQKNCLCKYSWDKTVRDIHEKIKESI